MSNTFNQLCNNLDKLKLTQMKDNINQILDYINANNLSFVDSLLKLTNCEIDFREMNAIKSMVRVGAFPFYKEIKDFDFEFQLNINRNQINDFLSLRFIENKENIVFLGTSGVGKTHLATAIGIAAAKTRVSTYFIKCHDLLMQLKKAKVENRLENRIKHFCKYKLLIIDELGYLTINSEDSNLFFQLIDKRYENKSTIITTNINFNDWDKVFKDEIVAHAILDRVLHHATVVSISGKSYRLKNHMVNSE